MSSSKNAGEGKSKGADTESAATDDSSRRYGDEGTNKTIPTPMPDAAPSAELQGTKSKFIPKTPYTRG